MQAFGIPVLLIVVTLSIFGSGYALAQKQPPTERVSIKTDQVNGRVEIIIDGKAVAVFESTGLSVRHDINYGGMMTDTGTTGFDQHYGLLTVDKANAR